MDSEAVVLIFHHFQTYNPIYFVNLRIMKLVIQRVIEASVSIGGELHSTIGQGLMVLVGVAEGDTPDDVRWLASKCVAMRIFSDNAGVMNRSLADVDGELLAVSQFTLCASTRKGNRPSYIRAAGHDIAIPLYEMFCDECSSLLGKEVKKGVFGADMQVSLVNDGPVTIVIDSKLKD
jgi:D-tyrosyl-tRNA(Tyr) deacylase